VLLLTPDTGPPGHFFNQTQSPWDKHKTTVIVKPKNTSNDKQECIKYVNRLTSNTATLELSGVDAMELRPDTD